MKKFYFPISFVLAAFLIMHSFDGWAGSNNFSARKTRDDFKIEEPLKTLTVGEKIEFEVFWMGIPVGSGSVEVKEKVRVHGREAFHIVAIAKTNDFLSNIYPVHDEVHSYIDAERLCSLEFRKTLREGRYRADERTVFDYESREGRWESYLKDEKKNIAIPATVQDALSIFYWFRLQPVTVGQSAKAVVNSRDKNWNVEIAVLARETKEIKGKGVIPTLKIEPKSELRDVLYKRGRAWVYVTPDKRRIPVWTVIHTPFGPVTGVLKSFGGGDA
jgi:hypothetical protein